MAKEIVRPGVFAAEEIDIVVERNSRHFSQQIFQFAPQNPFERVQIGLAGRVRSRQQIFRLRDEVRKEKGSEETGREEKGREEKGKNTRRSKPLSTRRLEDKKFLFSPLRLPISPPPTTLRRIHWGRQTALPSA